MNPLILDIETGPRADAIAFLPTPEAPANYKDPAKIAAYIEERKGALLDQAALSAETAQVLVIGLLRPGEEPAYIYAEDEADTLRETWGKLGERRCNEVFVTFNGARFDWPMLVRRSYALGVPVPGWMPRDGRWPKRTHVDLFEWWQAGDRQTTISLDRLARLVGLPGKTDTGARFAAMWAADRPKALAYLAHDLSLAAAIAERMLAGYEDRPGEDILTTDTAPPPAPAPTVPAPVPTAPPTITLLDAVKRALLVRHPDNTPEARKARATLVQDAFGLPWAQVQKLDAATLQGGYAKLCGILNAMASSPPAPAQVPESAPDPKAPAAEEELGQTKLSTLTEPELCAALATELRRVCGTATNAALAVHWMQRQRWITAEQAAAPDPFVHVSQERMEKALGAPERFLAAIGAQKVGAK
jgi:hypothetical protein